MQAERSCVFLLLGDEENFLKVTTIMTVTQTDVADWKRKGGMAVQLVLLIFLHRLNLTSTGSIQSKPSVAISPCILRTFKQDTMEAGNHMSDNFMVDDFNIRHSSQRGYSLESFNSQWSRGPLNQYGVLLQNGCVSWKHCRSQCNLIQPLGQASLNRNGKKNVSNRDRREWMMCVTLC